MITGAVLSVALVGSVAAAFAGCGGSSKDITYQYEAYCYDHTGWGLITLYADNTFDGYMCDCDNASDNSYEGTWETQENRFYKGLTITYTSVKNTGTGDVDTSEISCSAIADENGNFVFGSFILPMYVDNYAVMSGCNNVYCQEVSSDNFWTDYSEWAASVKGTKPTVTETVSTLLTKDVTSGSITYTATFTSDGKINVSFDVGGDQPMSSDGTWSVSSEALSISMSGNMGSIGSVTMNSDCSASFTYTCDMSGYGGSTYTCEFTLDYSELADLGLVQTLATLTCTDISTSVGTVYGYLYSDGTAVFNNGYFDSDATWSYSNGSFTIRLNGTTALTTTYTNGTLTVSYSSNGMTGTFTSSDVSIITGETASDSTEESGEGEEGNGNQDDSGSTDDADNN